MFNLSVLHGVHTYYLAFTYQHLIQSVISRPSKVSDRTGLARRVGVEASLYHSPATLEPTRHPSGLKDLR